MIFKKKLKLMGNQFEFLLLHEDLVVSEQICELAIQEIKRIEKVFTTFSDDSITNKINQNAGIQAIEVDLEVFNLLKRSLKISEITQGAFDISYGSIDTSFWNFDKKMTKLPNQAEAQKSVKLINFRNIILDEKNQTVFLKEKGMRIGFGGIGKGYAADEAKKICIKYGIKAGVVNASGDLTTWGKQESGKDWTVGIMNPYFKNQPFSYLSISDFAVATSGTYEKFVEIDGKKYSHTINPKTGFPTEGIESVTIIAPTAELADAFATPVMIMGIEVGLDLINQLNGFGCIIVDERNKIFVSKNVKIHC
jgi:FAD:protein FMN transferase